ncbi:class I SAM-dependent methyltransferase [Tenacibaculum amylolyticum]|uniref:class I SAM-dependent methyltransferase n=1 Tax=Tenacibaculum amylolyticum TaxID=104269 RepID=UPI0038950BC2
MITQENLTKGLQEYITTKDYSLTKEKFKLEYNKEFDLLVTNPIPKNLGKYYQFDEYISHTDSKKSLLDKVYQTVRNYTLQKKLKLINSLQTKEKSILDIGCGTGDFLLTCKKDGWKTLGIEPNKKAQDISKTKNLVIKETIEELSNEKYDVITLWHVLEHVPNLIEYIHTLEKLLKEEGRLIIAVPNFKSYDAKHYKNYWAAFDVPRHLWHFSQKSISKLFSSVNMEVIKTLPMKFDSYYVSLLSEKYKRGYMNPFFSFFVGLWSNFKAKQTNEYSSLIYIIKKLN